MFEISDSVALIIGGASEIGFKVAQKLLILNAKGIVIVDNKNGDKWDDNVHKPLVELKINTDKAMFLSYDVTDPIQLKNAFEATIKRYQHIDIVINTAEIFDELDWEKCINVNLNTCIRGTMLAVKEYFPQYAKMKSPIVINIASTAAQDVFHHIPIYSATKSGIVSFTQTFKKSALYLSNIRVISVCPGLLITPIEFDDCLRNIKPHDQEPFKQLLLKLSPQCTTLFAVFLMELIETAPSGSVWEIERNLKRLE